MDPLTIGLATGGAGALTLANGFMQQRAAAYNQAMYEKNTAANYMYSQQAQRNAARNEVEGLRAAGLSPVFADGSAAASAAAGSVGTAQAPSADAANLLALAQLENIKAQTAKTKADAKSTEIDNSIKEGENSTLAENMSLWYRKLAENTTDEEWKKFYLEQSDFAARGDFTRGNYDALIKYLDLQGKPEEAIERKLDKKLSAYLAELRWNKAKGQTLESNDFVKALGSLDARQSDLLSEQAAKLISERKNVEKDTDLIGAKITLTNEQIEQVKAAAAQLKDTNVMEFINQGDYGRALLAMLLQLFSGFASKGPPI